MSVFDLLRRKPKTALMAEAVDEQQVVETTTEPAQAPEMALDIAPNDPFLTYCQSVGGVVEMDKLRLDSPAVRELKANGVRLVVPLVSQGELIGLINLGPRLSEQDYSSDDRKLLNDLAAQAAPAVRVAQLVREQQAEARERERMEQELRVARIIQQTLLPHELPSLEGWQVSAYYQPARAVGGDFYDFIHFPDGKIALIIADVTDKGVPAALVMATTRSILRAAAERLVQPGAVLKRTNDVLQKEIPPKMFVTCFYALLDPATGEITYANAGHDVPYHVTAGGVQELRATGMPLGLMPGMDYEEKETTLAGGEYVLLYSDGLVEAHDPQREMFGFPRLKTLLAGQEDSSELHQFLLAQLEAFTGPDWEQEDDVTLVTLERTVSPPGENPERKAADNGELLAAFELPSEYGNERLAMQQVAVAVAELPLSERQLEQVKTAVAEATMNAMEHGNQYQADLPVEIEVRVTSDKLKVSITDRGGGQPIAEEVETPDLLAKLSGEQSPRGWGLFLIRNMVDEMHTYSENGRHTIELAFLLSRGDDDES